MENRVIKQALNSKSVRAMAKRFRLSESDVWNEFYETGIDYLEMVKVKVKRKRVFDRVFRQVMHLLGSLSPQQAFECIEFSPMYWQWWSSQFWEISRCPEIRDSVELSIKLQFSNIIIPQFILEKIFYDKQNRECRQRAGVSLKNENEKAGGEKSEARKTDKRERV